jgi:TonB family protein
MLAGSRKVTFVDRWWPRVTIAVAVLSLHTAVLKNVFAPHSRDSAGGVEAPVFASAEIIGGDGNLDKVPAPDLQLKGVAVDLASLHEIDFDDSVQDELASVIGSASAPHLARVQSADPAAFARRAQLPPGVALTTLLRVEVTDEGSVRSVDVIRPSGNVQADAAAVDYALELRWVPGTEGRAAKTMRVNFPVTLAAPAHAPAAAPRLDPCGPHAGFRHERECGDHSS